ncbi:MAG: hemerythrin domain-containing protein [Myxococcota bacterium]
MLHHALGIRFVHAAIIRSAAGLRTDAHEVDLATLLERAEILGRVVELHTRGEEVSVLPAVAERAPDVAAPFVADHEDGEALLAEIVALARTSRTGARVPDADDDAARETIAAFATHVLQHAEGEEERLVPALERLFSPAEQVELMRKLWSTFSPVQFAAVVPWILEHLDPAQRVTYLRDLHDEMEPEPFARIRDLVRRQLPAHVVNAISAELPSVLFERPVG